MSEQTVVALVAIGGALGLGALWIILSFRLRFATQRRASQAEYRASLNVPMWTSSTTTSTPPDGDAKGGRRDPG